MRPSLLQLEDYFFTETRINLSTLFNQEKEIKLGAEHIDCKIKSQYVEENDFYYVELLFNLESRNFPNANIPYDILLSVAGKVTVSPDYKDDKEQIAVINGASLLYSAIREHILYLTSRYPFGSILLPTLDFRGLVKNPKPIEE